MSGVRASTAPEDSTLDGGWDKRVRKGVLEPDRTIDLHGHTENSAHDALTHAIESAWKAGVRTLLVVTGRARGSDASPGRGVIAANFPRWVAAKQLRPFIAAVRPAHQRHGGGGAWYVILRRRQG